MTTKIGGIVVDIDARLTRLEANLEKGNREFKKFADRSQKQATAVERSLKGIGSAADFLTGALKGAMAAITVDALVRVTTAALNYAGSLGEAASAAGVGTKFLQEFRYAAGQNGVAMDQADATLAKFTRTIGDAARGQKSAVEAFIALGVSVRDSSGQVRQADVLFREVAEAIARIPDPATRASLAADVFGKSGARLLPLLEQGATGFDGLAAAAGKLGIVLDDRMIANADMAADKLDAMKGILTAQFAAAVAENADNLLRLADALGAVAQATIEGVAEFSNWQSAKSKALGDLVATRGKAGAAAAFFNGDFDAMAQANYDAMKRTYSGGRQRGSLRRQPGLAASRALSGGGGVSAVPTPAVRPSGRAAPTFAETMREQVIENNADLQRLGRELADSVNSEFLKESSDLMKTFTDDAIRIVEGRQDDVVNRLQQRFDAINARAARFGDLTAEAFGQWIASGGSLVDIFKRLAIQMLVIEPLLENIRAGVSGLFGGSSGGGLGSLIGKGGVIHNLFGGFFAEGGTLPAGKWGIAGERGPEMIFAGHNPLSVIPNAALAGGGVVINVDARGSADPSAVREQVAMGIAAALPSIVARSKAATIQQLQRPRIA